MTAEAVVLPRRRRGLIRRSLDRWPVKLAVAIIAVIWLVPTIGLFLTSFRPEPDIQSTGWWTVLGHLWKPSTWTFHNYSVVLFKQGFSNAFLNTLAVTIPATVIPISVAAFAAYAFAWMKFRGRQVLFVVVVGLMVIPLQMALIPILRLYTSGGHLFGITIIPNMNLNGTFPAVWLAHTGFGLPLAIYLLRNYIGGLPSSLFESARIDGATHFQIFTKLVVPLSVPVLASFAIFQFLWVWNDYLIALIFLGAEPRVQVITQAIALLVGDRGEQFHLLTAAAFVSMVLPITVFFSLQRFFVRGLTAGSVKG
ncbi:MAG: sugar ABC transporter permease [Actinobacteria bacterium RBG_16_68_21]|nr:MAG: sugar ABC transporter permease [Actinobacteria bacterium RBG_16_68_21]